MSSYDKLYNWLWFFNGYHAEHQLAEQVTLNHGGNRQNRPRYRIRSRFLKPKRAWKLFSIRGSPGR